METIRSVNGDGGKFGQSLNSTPSQLVAGRVKDRHR